MMTEQQLQGMNETALRSLARQLMSTLGEQTQVIESTQEALQAKAKEVQFKDTVIAKLSFEMATLRRAKFGRTAETLDAQQRALFEEAIDEDLAALDVQLDAVGPKKPSQEKRQPERTTNHSAPRSQTTCRSQRSSTSPRTPNASVVAS